MVVKKKISDKMVWVIPVITTLFSVYYMVLAFKQHQTEIVQSISQFAPKVML